MSEFGEEVDSILVKPGRDWTNEENNIIAKLMKSGRKQEPQRAMDALRDAAGFVEGADVWFQKPKRFTSSDGKPVVAEQHIEVVEIKELQKPASHYGS